MDRGVADPLAPLVRRYRAASGRTDAAREALYTGIRVEAAAGASLRALAARTGLSFGRVHQIVRS